MEDKNIIGNIIGQITKAFNQFVGTIKKHGLLYSLIGVILFILMWQLIVNPIRFDVIIEKRLEQQFKIEEVKREEYHKKLLERRYEANEAMSEIMTNILENYNCRRIVLLEKHNTLESLGRVDFLYLSASIELINPNSKDIEYMSDNLQRQVVYNLLGQKINEMLIHNKYLHYSNLNNYRNECKLFNKLIDAGESEVILYPFRNSENRTMVILIITGENINVENIVRYLDSSKTRIKDLLIYE